MKKGEVVLYAEDDENDVFFMERAFKQAGIDHRLHIASDGQKTIEYLSGTGAFCDREQYPLPCLILLDLSMPGMSGHEVLKWVRAQPAVCTLPVIVLTSSNQESDIHRAYLIGANGYLIKPGRPEELITMVKGVKDYWLSRKRVPGAYLNLSGDTTAR